MIDLHCHILHGMDDGAKTMAESIALCENALKNNIQAIMATPHFMEYNHYHSFLELRERRVDALREEIEKRNLDLGLGKGAEVYMCEEMFTVRDFEPLTLNGTRYILCEYNLEPFPVEDAVRYVECILSQGLIPIIAHPERYITFHENPWLLEELIDMGAMFQVNAASLAGRGGEGVKAFATDAVLAGFAEFVATDAHSPKIRTNSYLQYRKDFDERISDARLEFLTQKNPYRVISNQSFLI